MSSPRRCRCRRSASVTTVSTTSLTVPPSAFLIALTSSSDARVHVKRRSGRPSARCKACAARAASPPTPSRRRRPRSPRCGRAPARPAQQRRAAAPAARRRWSRAPSAPRPAARRSTATAAGATASRAPPSRARTARSGCPGPRRRRPARGASSRGSRSVPLQPGDEPHLPQRPVAAQLLGEHAPREHLQLVLRPRLRQRGLADVVARSKRSSSTHRGRACANGTSASRWR